MTVEEMRKRIEEECEKHDDYDTYYCSRFLRRYE